MSEKYKFLTKSVLMTSHCYIKTLSDNSLSSRVSTNMVKFVKKKKKEKKERKKEKKGYII